MFDGVVAMVILDNVVLLKCPCYIKTVREIKNHYLS